MDSSSFGFILADRSVVFDPSISRIAVDASESCAVVSRWVYTVTGLETVPPCVWVFLTGSAPLPQGFVLSVSIAAGSSSHAPTSGGGGVGGVGGAAALYLGCLTNEVPSTKFIVPCGAFASQFMPSPPSSSSSPSSSPSSADIALIFTVEEASYAAQRAQTVAAPAQGAHTRFVMRVGSAVTAAMREDITANGTWLPPASAGSEGCIVVAPSIIDRAKTVLEKHIEYSVGKFAAE